MKPIHEGYKTPQRPTSHPQETAVGGSWETAVVPCEKTTRNQTDDKWKSFNENERTITNN